MSHALVPHNDHPLVPSEPDAREGPGGGAPIEGDILSSPAAYRHAMELATTLSRSQLLPTPFRGKPEDVFMAIMLARKMGEDVFTILSNVHFVNGKPGWSAPFLIARANASGIFEGELTWETTGEGPSLAVTCSALLRKGGKRVSKTVSMEMARADGWTRNAKYSSIPEQMLSYRAATFLIRLYCPAILYGLHTADEWEDVAASRRQAVEYTDPPSSSAGTPRSATSGPRGTPAAMPPDEASIEVQASPEALSTAEQQRARWLEVLATLRESHGSIVSSVARQLGLRTPRQCTAEQLQQLCETVQEAIARDP